MTFSKLPDSQPWETLLEQTHFGIVLVSPDGQIQASNPKALQFLQCDQTLPEALQSQLLTEPTQEIDICCDDGSQGVGEIHWKPIEWNDETAYLGSIHDITPRKQYESQLQHAKQDAEAASLAKSAFLAKVSHEIRTPLNAILGVADLLKETPLDSAQQQYVNVYQNAGKNLLRLINDLLDFSQLESETLDIEELPFDVGELAETSIEMLALRAHQKGLELVLKIDPDVSVQRIGDPTRIQQILSNLIENAIKFTDEGGVQIHIRSQTDEILEFEVSDTGIGISEKDQPYIFESFTQLGKASTREFRGCGLGLSIVKNLVTLMGGSLTLKSQKGEGSCFTFGLPLPKQKTSSNYMAPASLELQDIKALVIDDMELNRSAVANVLRVYGFQAEEATSGKEGLQVLESACSEGNPYSLLIVDSQMPSMDGWEVMKHVQQHPELVGSAVMMVLMSDRRRNPERYERHGVSSTVFKPIRPNALVQTVTSVLNQSNPLLQPQSTSPDTQPSLKGLQVLVVEDVEANRFILDLYFQKTQCVVKMVENGQKAVDAAMSQEWDVVLMDIQMPVMDGYEATRKIRQYEQTQKRNPAYIVALTAYATPDEKQHCLDAGCDTYLCKPIGKPELLQLLENISQKTEPVISSNPAASTNASSATLVLNDELRPLYPQLCVSYRKKFQSMKDALESKDFEEIQNLAHQIKGTGGLYQLPEVAKVAQSLENDAKQKKMDPIPGKIQDLEKLLKDLETQLNS